MEARIEDMGRVYTPTKLCGYDLGQVTEGLWVLIYPQGFRGVGSACTWEHFSMGGVFLFSVVQPVLYKLIRLLVA